VQEIKYRRVGIAASFSSRRSSFVSDSTHVASSGLSQAGANERLLMACLYCSNVWKQRVPFGQLCLTLLVYPYAAQWLLNLRNRHV